MKVLLNTVVLVPPGVFRLKRSTAKAFVVPFRILTRKKKKACVVLELVPLRDEKISSHAHKTRSWHIFGLLIKTSDEHPRPFYMRVPPWGAHFTILPNRLSLKVIDLEPVILG